MWLVFNVILWKDSKKTKSQTKVTKTHSIKAKKPFLKDKIPMNTTFYLTWNRALQGGKNMIKSGKE